MIRSTGFLAFVLASTSLALGAPSGGGFAAGDLWMNAGALPGTNYGGLAKIDPITGQTTLVVPYTASFGGAEVFEAFCYDPWRDRILVRASLDNVFEAIWSIDALGNHTKFYSPGVGVAGLAPTPSGVVYTDIIGPFTGSLGYIDLAGVHHILQNSTGTGPYNPFGQPNYLLVAGLAYDVPSNSLLLAVGQNAGLYCTPSNYSGAVFQIFLSADGTRGVSQTCAFFDIDATYFQGNGGTAVALNRRPNGTYLLTARGPGSTGSMDDVAPRMLIVSTSPLSVTPYATNGPYTNAGWTNAGTWSTLRQQAVIVDSNFNELRGYSGGQSGGGNPFAVGLIGSAVSINERAGLIEIVPVAAAQGSLIGTPTQISLAAGGTQSLAMDFGASLANKTYFVLGSASGTAPSFNLLGHEIPLHLDSYTLFTAGSPNSALLMNSLGSLDPFGQAHAQFTLPAAAPPVLAGLVIHHAAIALNTNGTCAGVTNAAPLTLVP